VNVPCIAVPECPRADGGDNGIPVSVAVYFDPASPAGQPVMGIVCGHLGIGDPGNVELGV